jgi:hypothetical protein
MHPVRLVLEKLDKREYIEHTRTNGDRNERAPRKQKESGVHQGYYEHVKKYHARLARHKFQQSEKAVQMGRLRRQGQKQRKQRQQRYFQADVAIGVIGSYFFDCRNRFHTVPRDCLPADGRRRTSRNPLYHVFNRTATMAAKIKKILIIFQKTLTNETKYVIIAVYAILFLRPRAQKQYRGKPCSPFLNGEQGEYRKEKNHGGCKGV